MYRTDIIRRVREHRILHDVTLELTYRCNLDCFFCYNDRAKPGQPLSLAQYERLLEDLAEMQTLHLMLTGGEPMVHPHFFDIGRKARDLGFLTRVRTNGHSLNERLARRVKAEVDPYSVDVSLHGATPEVHDRQTRVPGSFDRLVSNIRCAKGAGLRVQAITTPTRWNEQELDALDDLCAALDITLRFQGPVAPRDDGDTSPLSIQPSAAAWEQVKVILERRAQGASPAVGATSSNAAGDDHAVEETPSTCGVGVGGVDIDPFGNVQACMHLQQSAGNLHEQSIREIWEGSPLFTRARAAAVAAAERFPDGRLVQFGAPLFCLAVEENCNKGCGCR
jgi:MoaA/NifB/PqqE/SkfB family radical SAM enzyme